MRELDVEVVVCAPAVCLSLAKAAAFHGHHDLAATFGVRLFLVLGEICTPAFAANVRSVWGATVHPTLYGSQEALAIATGCRNGAMHLSGLNYLVEIVDPGSGRVLGPRGHGELCLTILIDGAKPLVRYRTGDLVTVSAPAACGCDLPGDVVEVHGRVADGIRLGGADRHPGELESAVLDGVRGCLGYQIVIDTDGEGRDLLTVRMDLAGAEPAARDATRSWKAARIQDDRGERDAESRAARAVAARYAYAT